MPVALKLETLPHVSADWPALAADQVAFRYKGRQQRAADLVELSALYALFCDTYRVNAPYSQVWNSTGSCVAVVYPDGMVRGLLDSEVLYDPREAAREAFAAASIQGEFRVLEAAS